MAKKYRAKRIKRPTSKVRWTLKSALAGRKFGGVLLDDATSGLTTFEVNSNPDSLREVLTAFFMEATFLGIMLFGKHRVSNRVHLLATTMVAIGTTLSAFWIVSLNSWMQTPQGHEVVDDTFYARDWWAVIFNPSFPYRFFHVFIASLLTSAFLVSASC